MNRADFTGNTMSKDPKHATLQFDRNDIAAVDDFRKLTDTSVLTIMFTDIKGFTDITEEKGDIYANELRREHDAILICTIEEGNRGKVIKHIGDAIMAVFSEPSVATEKALAIQDRLDAFNRKHPDKEDIIVRIGLHMGQVTTENTVDTDVFGRHVNRASRIEGLADGGQIYMTYPVFDSAKGWLVNHEVHTDWILHGTYYVKGIKEPIAIYEVYNRKLAPPRPPKKAKKKRNIPAAAVIALSVSIFVCVILIGIKLIPPKPVTVTFIHTPNSTVYMDHTTKLIIEEEKEGHMRKCLTPIPVGKHVLHWDFNTGLRYYTDCDVKEGDNYFELKFKESRIVSIHNRHTYKPGQKNETEVQREGEYMTYDKQNKLVMNRVHLELKAVITEEEPDILMYDFTWHIDLNGKSVSKDMLQVKRNIAEKKEYKKRALLYKDASHYYAIKFCISGKFVRSEIWGGYIELLENENLETADQPITTKTQRR